MATDWGEEDDRASLERMLLRRVLRYIRPYHRAGSVALGCIVVGALLGLAPGLVFRALIDYLGRAHPSFGHVALLVGAGIAAAIAGGLVGLWQSYLEERISQGIIFDLREQVFDRLVHQSVGFHTSNRAGEVMSRIGNDINGIENVVADTVFGVARNAIVAASTLALMVSFDWRLTLFALVLIPSVAIPMRRAGRRVYQARGATQGKFAEMTAYLQEVLGIRRVAGQGVRTRARRAGALQTHQLRVAQSRDPRIDDRQALRHAHVRASECRPGADHPRRRVAGRAGPHHRRDGVRVRDRADAAFRDGGRVAARDAGQPDRLAGPVPAHLHCAQPLRRRRRPAKRARANRRARRAGARPGHVRLPRADATGPERLQRPHRARPARRSGRPERRGQDDPDHAHSALLRPASRPRDARQPRRARANNRIAAPPDRHRLPKHLPVPLHDPCQPALRPTRRHRGRDDGGRPGRLYARLHQLAARRLRHRRRRAGPPPLRRREATRRDRPRDPQEPPRPAARRGDLQPRHGLRAADPGRAAAAVRGGHLDRHRPPSINGLAADAILVLDHGRLVEQGTHSELLRHGGLYAELYERQFHESPGQVASIPLQPAAR